MLNKMQRMYRPARGNHELNTIPLVFKCEASVNQFGNNLKQRGYKKAKVLSFDLSGAEGVRPNP